MTARRQSGFTLVEVLVATLLLTILAVAVTETMLHAQRAQMTAARWMDAVTLAQDALERARLSRDTGSESAGRYRIDRTAAIADSALGLYEVSVAVEWNGPPVHRFTLGTLVRK